jgi:hypothetical protein
MKKGRGIAPRPEVVYRSLASSSETISSNVSMRLTTARRSSVVIVGLGSPPGGRRPSPARGGGPRDHDHQPDLAGQLLHGGRPQRPVQVQVQLGLGQPAQGVVIDGGQARSS